MPSVLFVCVHNSARSQMAEELLRLMAGDRFEVESAGLTPGTLHPLVVEVLKHDEGIDISAKATKSVREVIAAGRMYDYVITVCDEASVERCPLVPARIRRLHWSFEDPSRFRGPREARLAKIRALKDGIRRALERWIKEADQRAQRP